MAMYTREEYLEFMLLPCGNKITRNIILICLIVLKNSYNT